MKANAVKCHLLISSNKKSTICVDNNFIINSKYGKLLGKKTDQKLSFNAHINDICKKSGNKVSTFSRITPYISI